MVTIKAEVDTDTLEDIDHFVEMLAPRPEIAGTMLEYLLEEHKEAWFEWYMDNEIADEEPPDPATSIVPNEEREAEEELGVDPFVEMDAEELQEHMLDDVDSLGDDDDW